MDFQTPAMIENSIELSDLSSPQLTPPRVGIKLLGSTGSAAETTLHFLAKAAYKELFEGSAPFQ